MTEPPGAPAAKRIAVFLDGTWNTVNDNTNVWRLKSLMAPASRDGRPQSVYYSTGVGTTYGERLRGGMFGYGLNDEIIRAYEWLIDQYNDGDELFLFGFSRGAYTARSLSGLISKCGLLTAGAPLSVGQLYARYRQGGVAATIRELAADAKSGRTDFGLEEQWILRYSQPIDIMFLGVWDTVGALGLPFGDLPILGKSDMQFLNTGIRVSNKFAYHALAIDEHRKAFAPTLWTADLPTNSPGGVRSHRPVADVEQRWFVGAHANVGGGCVSDALAQLPLKWMMEKAALHGLAFRREIEVDHFSTPPSITDSYSEFLHGAYKFVTGGHRFFREIGAAPTPSSSIETRITINETIDASVFDRWRADTGYRPPGLQRWASGKNVRPEEFHGSVRADTPDVAV